MKSLILNIKNLVPYLILILVYFYFINIEALKNKRFDINNVINKDLKVDNIDIDKTNLRKSIPILPYEK